MDGSGNFKSRYVTPPDPLDRILIFSLESLVLKIQAKFEVSSFSRSQDMRGSLFTSGVACRLVFVSHDYSVRKVNHETFNNAGSI